MFDWRDVYPGSVVVKMVLTKEEARALLARAQAEGRVIGRNVVRGEGVGRPGPQRPALRIVGEKDLQPETRKALVAMAEAAVEQLSKAPETAPERPSNVTILPVIHRTALTPAASRRLREGGAGAPAGSSPAGRPDAPAPAIARRVVEVPSTGSGGGFLALQPPPAERGKPEPDRMFVKGRGWVRRGEITAADRALVAEAVAQGKVRKCPPNTVSLTAEDEIAQLNPHAGKAGRLLRGRAEEILSGKAAQPEPKAGPKRQSRKGVGSRKAVSVPEITT